MSRNIVIKSAAALAIATLPATALASSHREAPAVSFDPAADNTDVYAWVEPGTHDKLHIVANWVPLEEPSGGPNFHKFSDDVLYEIHVMRGNDFNDVVTYQFRFDTDPPLPIRPEQRDAAVGGGKEFFIQLTGATQTMTVIRSVRGQGRQVLGRRLSVAPPNIGPRTDAVVRQGTAYDDTYAATFVHDFGADGGKVWAGPRDDGFYVDLGGVFDLANLRAQGTAQDGVSGYNVHSIAIEIPTRLLTANGQAPGNTPGTDTTIGVWASSKRRMFTDRLRDGRQFHFGPWVQVSRLGLPLINEAMIGIQDKDFFNATHPRNDVENFGAYLLNPVVVRDAEAVGIYTALGADADMFKWDRTDILDIVSLNDGSRQITAIGDVLRLDMATDSGFPNGRPLIGGARPDQEQADVTDVLLSVILARGALNISDGVQYNDKPFLTSIPWLPLPHRGFDEGHGIPTPQ